MPLIFIHGVSNRIGSDYIAREENRDSFFRLLLLPTIAKQPTKVKIFNPYWGDCAARPYWNNASLPTGQVYEPLGTNDQILAALVPEIHHASPHAVLLSIAKTTSVKVALDLFWSKMAEEGTIAGKEELLLSSLKYCAENPHPAWLADSEITSDEQFIARLLAEITKAAKQSQGLEGFGSLDFGELEESACRLSTQLSKISSTAFTHLARTAIQQKVSLFLGDAFVYFNERWKSQASSPRIPGPIPARILDALTSASKLRESTDPLIVVAHSMGGNILYDLCTDFAGELDSDFQIDVLVTVGSQFSLFQELDVFNGAPIPQPFKPGESRMPRPTNIERWINVFDKNDMFGYAASGIFDGVEDFEYDTGFGVALTHSGYFCRPSFYRRIAERLSEVYVCK